MYKITNKNLTDMVDNQIKSVIKSMFQRARDKGAFGKYFTGSGKVKDSVTEDDIAKMLWPTVGGPIPAAFKAKIKNRLEALVVDGEISK